VPTLVGVLVDLISYNVFCLASEPVAHFLQSSLFDHVFKKMLVYKMNKITLSGKINISFPKKYYVSTVYKALLLLLSLPYMCAPQHANCNLRGVFCLTISGCRYALVLYGCEYPTISE
jgi:hypothetical protein